MERHLFDRINISKMANLLKTIYTFSTVPINLHIRFITKIGGKKPKIHLNPQKTQDGQSNPEQNEWCPENIHTRFPNILQSCSIINSMVLTQCTCLFSHNSPNL